ncbi:hypothetical protein GCM10028792_14230 [Salinisphaera aquimarina]
MRPGVYTRAGIALISLWLVSASAGAVPHGVPYVPDHDDTVLEQVPATTDPRVRRFEKLGAEHKRNPDDRELAIRLSRAYVDYGRSTGDARFLGRALVPLEPWLDDNPVPVDVMIVHATILQSRHDFDAARAELKATLKRAPGNAQGWLTLATVDMVQGRFEDARTDCVHTTNTGGQYLSIVCNGALLSLTGRAAQAYRLLALIADQTRNVPVDVQAYVQGLLADAAARSGDNAAAERHYRHALQLTPGDNFLLDNYGDFLLDANRPADALALVKNHTASDTALLRAVLAKAALGRADVAADIQAMADRFTAMAERGSHVYEREQARFALELQHDPDRALALARDNWKTQRAPQDVRIFLASALAADKPPAAQPIIDFLDRSHMSDPHLDALAAEVRARIADSDAPDNTGADAEASS